MNRNKWVRQTHRWVSIAFMLAAIVNFVALGQGESAEWVYLLPLPPLALLLLTGLYLFVLPFPPGGAAPDAPIEGTYGGIRAPRRTYLSCVWRPRR